MTPDAELGGYAEVRGSYQVGVDGTPWEIVERVRPTFEIAPAERITATATVEASLAQGRVLEDELVETLYANETPVELLGGVPLGEVLQDPSYCTDLREPRYDEIGDYLSVERLHVDFNLPVADITVGRQAIAWGSGLVYHPTDLFAEVVATEPWRERRGVDAVKVDVPLADHSLVVLGAIDDDLSPLYADEPEPPGVAGAMKFTLRELGTDWSAIARAGTDGDWFVGGDLRGTLGVGWWVEGGWHGEDEAPEVVAGVDYSFPVLQMFYVAAEYRYDGTGSRPEDYDFTQRGGFGSMPLSCAGLGDTTDVGGGDRTTLGIHYVDAIVNVGVTEDFGVTVVGIANVLDGTGMLVPDANVKIGQRIAVHAGAQIPFGEDGEFRPAKEDLTLVIPNVADIDLSGLLPDATALAWVRYSF
ncbi:MAG: hypothetical protein ACOZNI_02590 [Myxococcota bacterium]